MVRDAEINASEDKKKRELIELHNQADSKMYNAEKFIRESGDKLQPDQKNELEKAIADLRNVASSSDANEIEKHINTLNELMMKLGGENPFDNVVDEAMKGATNDGKVVDAEFKDVSDKK